MFFRLFRYEINGERIFQDFDKNGLDDGNLQINSKGSFKIVLNLASFEMCISKRLTTLVLVDIELYFSSYSFLFSRLTISIWPVYTWFSAPLLFIIIMGLIVIVINITAIL